MGRMRPEYAKGSHFSWGTWGELRNTVGGVVWMH